MGGPPGGLPGGPPGMGGAPGGGPGQGQAKVIKLKPNDVWQALSNLLDKGKDGQKAK